MSAYQFAWRIQSNTSSGLRTDVVLTEEQSITRALEIHRDRGDRTARVLEVQCVGRILGDPKPVEVVPTPKEALIDAVQLIRHLKGNPAMQVKALAKLGVWEK